MLGRVMGRRTTLLAAGLLLALSWSCGTPQIQRRLVVTGAGGALERVTTEPVSELHPTVSTDGRALLFEVRTYDSATRVTQQTLVGVDPNTRAQRTLYTSTNSLSCNPAWLPDGSSYVYASNSPGAWSLVRALTSAPNAAVTVIASGEIAPQATWPALSPDGSRVAFSAVFSGQEKVAVIGIDGSRLTILGEGTTPAWSPDGKMLAFVRVVGAHSHLFLVEPGTGTGLTQLTSGDFDHEMPSWSPDGRLIVFTTSRGWEKHGGGSPKRIRNLYVITRDGTGLTQLTDGNTYTTSPHWGRDNWIYFASNQSGNLDIWRLKPAGEWGTLQPVGASDWSPPPAAEPTEPTEPTESEPAPATEPEPASPAPTGGCTKDTDCKGERICEKGKCVSPK